MPLHWFRSNRKALEIQPASQSTKVTGMHGFTIGNLRSFNVQNFEYQEFQGRPVLTGADILMENVCYNTLFSTIMRLEGPQEHQPTGILGEIQSWIASNDRILCLTGAASTHRSSILQTAAEFYAKLSSEDGSPPNLSTFFFNHSDATRNTKTPLILTLAFQISNAHPELQPHLHASINRDPLVFTKSLERQIQLLIIDPWNDAYKLAPPVSRLPHVIFIDAVNECGREHDQSHVLSALSTYLVPSSTSPSAFPFKLILSSRPNIPIHQALAPGGCLHHRNAHHITLDQSLASIPQPSHIVLPYPIGPHNSIRENTAGGDARGTAALAAEWLAAAASSRVLGGDSLSTSQISAAVLGSSGSDGMRVGGSATATSLSARPFHRDTPPWSTREDSVTASRTIAFPKRTGTRRSDNHVLDPQPHLSQSPSQKHQTTATTNDKDKYPQTHKHSKRCP